MISLTIFITGATGVLGKRVCSLLIQQGHRVRALCRSQESATYCRENGIDVLMGSLFNKASMLELTRGCDVIMHLASKMPQAQMPGRKDWQENDRIRVEGTANLAEAAIANKVRLFIQPSVAFVYGNHHGEVVTEKTEVHKNQLSMVESAIVMESIIQQELREVVPYIILRFGMFYSEDSFHTLNMIRNVSDRRMPIVGKQDYYWNFIHVDDAAAAILHSLQNRQRLANEILNVSDFNPVSDKSLLKEISRIVEAPVPYTIPAWVARLLLGRDIYGFITNSYRMVKSDKLKDWHPRVPAFLGWVNENYGSRIASEGVYRPL